MQCCLGTTARCRWKPLWWVMAAGCLHAGFLMNCIQRSLSFKKNEYSSRLYPPVREICFDPHLIWQYSIRSSPCTSPLLGFRLLLRLELLWAVFPKYGTACNPVPTSLSGPLCAAEAFSPSPVPPCALCLWKSHSIGASWGGVWWLCSWSMRGSEPSAPGTFLH